MSKHTKGPWETDRNNVHTARIAIIHGCKKGDWLEIWSPNAFLADEEEMEANARLIAVAPEQHEALQATQMLLERLGLDSSDEYQRNAYVIAKATGEKE